MDQQNRTADDQVSCIRNEPHTTNGRQGGFASGPYQRKVKCHPWNSAAVSGPRRRSGPL